MVTTEERGAVGDLARARRLHIHAVFDRDEDGDRRLDGWVACPEIGRVELDRCTQCSKCRGVLIEPELAGPEVLCTSEAPRVTSRGGDAARNWVGRPALAVTPDVAVRELGQLMLDYDAEALVVATPHGEPLGVVTERDVLAAIASTPAAQAAAVMRPVTHVLAAGAGMREAATRLREADAPVVLIADDAGHVTGMLTRADVLRWALDCAPSE